MDQIQDEFKKCAKSFKYFCETYVKIMHPKKGLISFILFPYQERVVQNFIKFRFNIVSKFRQAGLTTIASIYGLWKCIFDLDFRVLVLSKSDSEAIGVGKIVQLVLDNLPDWLKPKMKTCNDHEKEFSDTNGIMWFYTPEAARSKSVSFLIVDEAAFIKKMHDHWKSMYPTLSNGGSCAVISTVNGVGNWYEETYHKAKAKKNLFNVIELDYKEHPEYNNPEWENMTRANLGDRAWAQEILRQFTGSGDTYLPGELLAKIKLGCEEPVRKLFPEWDSFEATESEEFDLTNGEYTKGAMWQWEPPIPGREYFISVDSGAGLGENCDSSTFQVIDIETYEQVAEFQSNIIPLFDFSKVIAETGIFYNDALVLVEDNGIGISVIQRLINNLKYENIYYTQTGGTKDRPGIKVNKDNRCAMLETMRTFLSEKLFKPKSMRLYNELLTFIINRSNNKPQASSKKHDDLILALASGLYILDSINHSSSILSTQKTKDVVTEAANIGLDNIRKALEEGMEDDFDLDDFDPISILSDYSPVTSKKFVREHDSLLKSFGF